MSVNLISKGKYKVDVQVLHPDGTTSRRKKTVHGTKKDAEKCE